MPCLLRREQPYEDMDRMHKALALASRGAQRAALSDIATRQTQFNLSWRQNLHWPTTFQRSFAWPGPCRGPADAFYMVR